MVCVGKDLEQVVKPTYGHYEGMKVLRICDLSFGWFLDKSLAQSWKNIRSFSKTNLSANGWWGKGRKWVE